MRRQIDSLHATTGRKLQTTETGMTAEGSRTDLNENNLMMTETVTEIGMLAVVMIDTKLTATEVTLLGQTGHATTMGEAQKGRTARGTGAVT